LIKRFAPRAKAEEDVLDPGPGIALA